MGFEAHFATKGRPHDFVFNPLLSMKVSSSHKRSKSEPEKQEDKLDISHETPNQLKLGVEELKGCSEPTKKRFPEMEQSFLKRQEIAQLQRRLCSQFVTRDLLEETLGNRSSINGTMDRKSMPKPVKELIEEISVLELEVVHLEQYLLSLYRKAFNQQMSCVSCSTKDGNFESPPVTQKGACPKINGSDNLSKRAHSMVHSNHVRVPHDSLAKPRREINPNMANEMLLDSGIYRSHSTLSLRSAYETRNSPPMEDQAKGIWSFHSQPLSSFECPPSATSSAVSLAEHMGTSIADHAAEAPNRISEDMIKCVSSIYCRTSEPPLTHHGFSSPISSLSSESLFSPQDQFDIWSPCHRKAPLFDSRHLDNSFHMEGLKEFSGPYSTMAEVSCICRDSQRLNDIDDMLQKYKTLVHQLEKIDISKLKHKEKLAFWINIHNALVMHALLVYGVPQNNVKRMSLILKAAYNVGGQTISADTIQSSILGCRMPRPVQWLRVLFSPKIKFKAGDNHQSYAIEHPEPLLHFALCSGSHSDPALRMYTPKKVFQELETAREEYIRATLGVRKEQKILLPKIVESFAKDSSLCPASVAEMIQQSIPETLRKTLPSFAGRFRKNIEWVPHNFAFRYLISNELVR